jgi:hypothetical protein
MVNFSFKSSFSSFIEFLLWILPVCLNVNTLTLNLNHTPIYLQDKIARLEKLKEIGFSSWKAPDLRKVESAFRIFENATHALVVF